jgi:hypothetical protein
MVKSQDGDRPGSGIAAGVGSAAVAHADQSPPRNAAR